ncbi:MAG TPA: hypothetical protein VFI61_00675 [Patescibacteria group bacterium]|nr:hypothetical protein [Patescibacteria group bacterium]
MIGILTLTLALVALYILSRIFIQKLFNVLYRFTGNNKRASVLLGLIFLPGTFVHEISHFLTALFLLVPVSDLNLMPEVQEDGVKLGSVSIGRSDFIRRSIIGIAPLIVGAGIIFWVTTYIYTTGKLTDLWFITGLVYLIFQLTHTMFSSKKDLSAVLELVVFVGVVSAFLVIFKIYSPFTYIYQSIQGLEQFILKLSYFVFIPIGLELIFLAMFRKIRV